MYYVLQVVPGTEVKTETYIMAVLPDGLYGQCFHPTRHMRKKFHGIWKDVHEKLLPGYVFITTRDIERLYAGLKKIPMFTKLLGRDGGCFVKLTDKEVEWLELLTGQGGICGNYRYEAALSQVSVGEGNSVRVISGPLKDMEGMVKKINLHHRVAEVEIEFMGRRTIVHLGIELLEQAERC